MVNGKKIRARLLFERCDENLLNALHNYYLAKTPATQKTVRFSRWQFRRACAVLQILDPNCSLLPEGKEVAS